MKTEDIKLLWGRAAGHCSFPDCRKQLCPYPVPGVILGEMCHIVAKSETGPRGEDLLPSEERDRYANLILLCQEHHTVIDRLPGDWSATSLHLIKAAHEGWVEEQLRSGALGDDISLAVRRVARYLERQRWLEALIFGDIGNARFLHHVQESQDATWVNINAGREFRDQYLDFLDDKLCGESAAPFCFDWLDAIVVFPDGYDEAVRRYPGIPSVTPEVPILLTHQRFSGDTVIRLEVPDSQPLPFLPLRNGYIWGQNEETGLPNDVRDEPCEDC